MIPLTKNLTRYTLKAIVKTKAYRKIFFFTCEYCENSIEIDASVDEYKYCPYCGKRIYEKIFE